MGKADWVPADLMGHILAALMPENALALRVSLATGLRIDDVLSLRRIDIEKGQKFTIREKKTGKSRRIYLPALRSYLMAGCRVALGLCWKAGVAAEVIGVSRRTVGGMLYESKVYLEIADLFAWTAVIVVVSAVFEKLFLTLLRRGLDLWEGK